MSSKFWHSILITVLQRNTHSYTNKEIYYKKLAQVVMETEESRDLQLISWKPRSWWCYSSQCPKVWVPESWQSKFHSESLQTWKLGRSSFHCSLKAGKRPLSQDNQVERAAPHLRGGPPLVYIALLWIRWGRFTLGRKVILFKWVYKFKLTSSKNTLKDTQYNVWLNIHVP